MAIFLQTLTHRTHTKNSPANDLELSKKVITTDECVQKTSKPWPNLFQQFVKNAREMFRKHCGSCLYDFCATFSLSKKANAYSEKQRIRRVLIKDKGEINMNARIFHLKQKHLKNFAGNAAWKVFYLFDLDFSFISQPVAKWKTNECYQYAKVALSKLPDVTDAVKRLLGLATDKSTKTCPEMENELQAFYTVIKAERTRLS